MGFKEIAGIVAELAKIVEIIMGRTNSPEMVQGALSQFRQDLADKAVALDRKLADPTLTPAQHQAALATLRVQQS